jgi:hypothetical protein
MPATETNPPDLSLLLAAIVTRLRADSTVTAKVGQRIYSNTPEAEAMPLIVVAIGSAGEWDDKTASGWDVTVTITAHSDGRGAKECLQIIDLVNASLHRYGSMILADGGGAVVLFQRVRTESGQAADGLGFDATSTFQALVNQD